MELIASALLDPLCERVISATLEEYKLVRNVKEEIGKLSFTVSLIREVLQDAEEQREKGAICKWLGELKQVLFDAEDVLDEAATDVILQTREVNGSESVIGKRAKVCNMICCFGTIGKILSSHHIAHQIRTINLRLDVLYKQKDGLELRVLRRNNWPLEVRHRVRPDTGTLLPDESYIIGRGDDKEKIIAQLLSVSGEGGEPMNSSNNVDVLAIVGMGGVGKTTLAQLVCNDQTVKQHFHESIIWVCVSEDFDVNRMYKELMDALAPQKEEKFEIFNWDLAQKRLKHKVEEKRFLLVLDDVWEENHSKWESFYKPLKYGGKGSKIVITTRIKQVADMTKAFPITLKNLASEDLWPIFKRYAFDGYSSDETMHLEAVGRNINDKLKGSPLAAKIIGRLLNSNLDMKFWKNVMKNESLLQEHYASSILPILKLSYDHLPGYLKQCFAYCSLFPKDHEFNKAELVQLWMAQNFIQTTSIGDQYFNDLLYRSFFEQRGTFVMHDLVHDLAQSVSKDECFKLGDDNSDKKIPETVRHLSLCTDKFDLARLRELCEHQGKLRALLFMCKCRFDLTPHLDDICMKLKRLRALTLRGCKIRELPASIGNLKHLRFLDLFDALISKLPESFCNLHNLQVLILPQSGPLPALPTNMSALINLRYLGPPARRMNWPPAHLMSNIQGLRKLTALEEVSVSGNKVGELADMGMLRKLALRDLDQVKSKEEAMQARLDLKEHLYELALEWNYGRDRNSVNTTTLDEEVLDSLQPVDSIGRLSVKNYGGVRSPSWMEDHLWLSSCCIQRLELHNCTNWEVLPPLGQLRRLKSLTITGMNGVRRIGPELFGCGPDGGRVKVQGFPLLEVLWFYHMPEWEEWVVPHKDNNNSDDVDQGQREGSQQPLFLPRLRSLYLSDCPKLRELPPLPSTLEHLYISRVGLTRLPGWLECCGVDGDTDRRPSLSSLDISNCPNLTSLGDGLLQHPLGSIETLKISNCEGLACLPERAFGHLTSLKSLNMLDCPKLSWPSSTTKEDVLPSSLQQIEIRRCGDMLAELSLAGIRKLTSLSRLVIDADFPDMLAGLGELTALTSLELGNHVNLSQEFDGLPSSLERLSIKDNASLDDRALSTCLQRLTSLKVLVISNCPAITTLPTVEVLCRLTTLRRLEITGCNELTSLGGSHALVSLEELEIKDCPKLLNLGEATTSASTSTMSPPPLAPQTTTVMMHLKQLDICRSSPQQITVWLRQCLSLRRLSIEGCPQLTCFDDNNNGGDVIGRELEVALLNLAPSLRHLEFWNCENLRSLPSKLRCLSSLQTLTIYWCPQIRCLPSAGLPESLQGLEIAECPALEERCREWVGPDWPLISHIAEVTIR